MLHHHLQRPQEKSRPDGSHWGGGETVGQRHREDHEEYAQPQPPAEERAVSLKKSATGKCVYISILCADFLRAHFVCFDWICASQNLTSKCQLAHQLHAESRQERGQQDDPEGAEALPASDQCWSGRHLRRRNFQGESLRKFIDEPSYPWQMHSLSNIKFSMFKITFYLVLHRHATSPIPAPWKAQRSNTSMIYWRTVRR